MPKNKQVIVISGPSGVGKTTICERLIEEEPKIKPCITATTRPPRPGEIDSKDYYFINKEAFKTLLKKGEIIEYTELFNNLYGTPKKSIEEIFNQGCYPLLRIDVKGAKNIKQLGYQGVFIFILPPNLDTLVQRLKKRQTSQFEIEQRVAKAKEELKYQDDYTFHVVNDDLTRAVTEIKNILSVHLFKKHIVEIK